MIWTVIWSVLEKKSWFLLPLETTGKQLAWWNHLTCSFMKSGLGSLKKLGLLDHFYIYSVFSCVSATWTL